MLFTYCRKLVSTYGNLPLTLSILIMDKKHFTTVAIMIMVCINEHTDILILYRKYNYINFILNIFSERESHVL